MKKEEREKKKEEDPRWKFMSFNFYKKPEDEGGWLECPECGLKPRVWVFDNGRSAHCVCGENSYNHKYEVKAKPIMDFVRKTGGFSGYDSDELRKNWNNLVKTNQKQ